jgi:hypothetical protein
MAPCNSSREKVVQTTGERRPSLPASFGQSVIAGNSAGKDGRRSPVVCHDSFDAFFGKTWQTASLPYLFWGG